MYHRPPILMALFSWSELLLALDKIHIPPISHSDGSFLCQPLTNDRNYVIIFLVLLLMQLQLLLFCWLLNEHSYRISLLTGGLECLSH